MVVKRWPVRLSILVCFALLTMGADSCDSSKHYGGAEAKPSAAEARIKAHVLATLRRIDDPMFIGDPQVTVNCGKKHCEARVVSALNPSQLVTTETWDAQGKRITSTATIEGWLRLDTAQDCSGHYADSGDPSDLLRCQLQQF